MAEDIPRSRHILSHLNSNQAFSNYRRDIADKLVRKQEELVYNLSKVRQQLEMEEDEIGRACDFYIGDRNKKYSYLLNRAERLKNKRSDVTVAEEDKLPLVSDGYDADEEKFTVEIERLKQQLRNVAGRYYSTDGIDSYSTASLGNRYLRDVELDSYEVGGLEAADSTPLLQSNPPKYIAYEGNVYQVVSGRHYQ